MFGIVKKYSLLILAVILFTFVVMLADWREDRISSEIAKANARIAATQAQLEEAHTTIGQMKQEHDAALNVVNMALQERIELYEMARERICEAERKIGENSDFCEQFIPDDMRMLWEKPAAGNSNPTSSVPAAN